MPAQGSEATPSPPYPRNLLTGSPVARPTGPPPDGATGRPSSPCISGAPMFPLSISSILRTAIRPWTAPGDGRTLGFLLKFSEDAERKSTLISGRISPDIFFFRFFIRRARTEAAGLSDKLPKEGRGKLPGISGDAG